MFGKSAVFTAALVAGVLVAGGGALAYHPTDSAPKTPGGQAAAMRHHNFGALGAAFKAINDELKKDSPDKAVLTTNANTMATLGAQLPTWFPKGSGREAWSEVNAKAEVWSDAAGFAAAAAGLKTQTAKLQQVAASGDIDAIKAQARATGGACKTCHDKYREEEKKKG
jgi:cytochrome c556